MITSLKIKELAKEKNLTLKKLALGIGLSEAGFHKMLKSNKFKVEELKKISQLFNVPLTALMSLDDLFPVDPKTVELQNEILKLKNRIEELSEQLTDKRIIIIKLNSEIQYITEKLSKKTQEKFKISDLYEYYLNEADKEFPVFMQLINSDIEDRKEGWEEEILKASKRRREICEEKFLNDPEIKKHIEQGKTIEYFRKIFKSF